MIDSLTKSIGLILRHPFSLWPALALGLVSSFFALYLSGPLADVTYSLFVDGNIPAVEGGALELLFALYSAYGGAINLLLVSWAVVGVLSILVMFHYAHFAKDQRAGIGQAFGQLGGVIAYLVFYALVTILAFAIFMVLVWLTPWLGGLSIVLFLATMLAGGIVFLRLAFTVPAMALKKLSVKKGLEESWRFTKGRLFEVFIFFILVSVVAVILGGAQNLVLDILEILYLDQTLVESLGFGLEPLLVTTLFSGLATAFTGLAFPVYYLSKARS